MTRRLEEYRKKLKLDPNKIKIMRFKIDEGGIWYNMEMKRKNN